MTFSPDQQIGAYRVIRLLGEGGMGAVYEVEHAELGTHYALKTFVYDGADEYADMLLNKFREEAKMLSRINHPNVSRAFDLTHDKERGILYYVMDLVLYKDGESYSLGEVDRASLTEDHVYRWFCDACEALDHIHSLGIVHRDVKLDNFLINSDKHAVLADFGVSRIFGKQMKKDVAPYKTMRIKRSGSTEVTVLGSDHYIAPEVLAGQEATPAADAYGLGIMIFKLFTDEWADKKSPAQVDAFLHGYKYRWYKVVPQLVAFDPAKRPTKLSELIGLLDREPSPVVEDPKVAVLKKKSRKRFDIVRFLVTSLFVVGFVAGASWLGYQGFLKYDADRKSQADRMNAELKRQIAEQKEASQKIAAEQQRLRDEAARQKSEAEKIAEAKRRREAEEREKEAQRITIGKQENAAEKKSSVKLSAAPVPKEKKDEFVLLDSEVEKGAKDYGPIPNKTYTWLKGGNAALPQEVKFQLSNGAVIDLVPLKAATFYMSNDWRDGRTHHKVTLTRPFWMSKFLLTADQCRDFAPNDYEDCRAIEKALEGTGYTVSRMLSRKLIDTLCKYLSEKYCSQLPKGYVFRLPTEAEWEYARDLQGTIDKYDEPDNRWWNKVKYSSPQGAESMRLLRKQKNLDLICEWKDRDDQGENGGFANRGNIFVGGRMHPFSQGIFDLSHRITLFLDIVDPKRQIQFWNSWRNSADDNMLHYDDVSTDPLAWMPDVEIYRSAKVITRYWENKRNSTTMNDPALTHIVLGPDLIFERAWERLCAEEPRKKRLTKLTMMPHKWEPKNSPRKLNDEIKYSFNLDNGSKIEFCLCPAGMFRMSNIPGQDKSNHEVKLTRPFLMTKYNITADQWRDYGPCDCEGAVRRLESFFAQDKYPICVERNYLQWMSFCEYMTARYHAILPTGYAFRLPTEAELEWAMRAGSPSIGGEQFDDFQPRFADALMKQLDKKRFVDQAHFQRHGYYKKYYVGGRTERNAWGLCDWRMGKACLDLLCADRRKYPESRYCGDSDGDLVSSRERLYDENETDPLRWDGLCGWYYIARNGWTSRRLFPMDVCQMAHIVIAPDVISDLKSKEAADYPLNDFGGVFLGKKAKVSGLSSNVGPVHNSEERYKLLLSRENVIVREKDKFEDLTSAYTTREDAPWVQIELGQVCTLTGLQVELFRNFHFARHLRVWVSAGGKEMPLVAKEDRQLQRYRFDLQGKNIKAKYIRIGREPGFMKECFCLNKVLIYGK